MKLRRWLSAFSLYCALLAGVAAPQDAAAQNTDRLFQGQSLRVAVYGGVTGKAFRDALSAPFEERTGARIEWSEGAPLDFIAQLAAAKGGTPPYDVIFIEDLLEPQAIAQNLIVKPDYDKIPNAKLLAKDALPSSGYGPAWGYFRLGIAYLPDKLKQAGVPTPKDISVIFDQRLAGHLSMPDVNQTNWPHYMPTIASFLHNPVGDPAPTLATLSSIKGISLYSSSSDLEARMSNGEIWVSLWVDGRVNGLKLKGLDIDLAPLGIPNPKGGTFDYTAILGLVEITNAAKKDLAEIWMDTLLSTPVETKVSLAITYAPANEEAQKAVKADAKVGPMIDTDLDKQYQVDFKAWEKVEDKWIDAWGKSMRR